MRGDDDALMAVETRPDPDELLAQVKNEEARARRGRLRIFFGATAGVGKTFAMLSAAQAAKLAGLEIVSGYVQPHGRVDTEGLAEGLEALPTLPVAYRGMVRQEFDLDTALKRRPGILLVDELAHSNLVGGDPPPRHPKRWQDVDELLDAGINVWTTLNVQHLESLNDLVAQITGVKQRETLPDHVFDEADEVELIDLPPDDLLARLHAGKVYVPDEVGTAVERFFRKPNLIALRELALRRMTQRVEAAARASLAGDRSSREWLARDHLLVAIGPDAQAEQLVRAGKRIADAVRAKWTVVYVETPDAAATVGDGAQSPHRSVAPRRVARRGDRDARWTDGRRRCCSSTPGRATPRVSSSAAETARLACVVATLDDDRAGARARRDFDVVTVGAMARRPRANAAVDRRSAAEYPQAVRWKRYPGRCRRSRPAARQLRLRCSRTSSCRTRDACTARRRRSRVCVSGAAVGPYGGPNVLAFDFFFVPPRFTFSVADVQYLRDVRRDADRHARDRQLMASVRQQTRVAGARERRTALLYAMSRELAATRGGESMARLAVEHVAEVFECEGSRAPAECGRPARLSQRQAHWTAPIAAQICRWRSGWSITADARVSARTRCLRRLRCICR